MVLSHKTYEVDYVVVGCGIAGLRAAIELSHGGSVLVLTKSGLGEVAGAPPESGGAFALGDDEILLHEQDTIEAGDGLCRIEAVSLLVEEGPKYLTQLVEWSGQLNRAGAKLAFMHEMAHSRARILQARGEPAGREITRVLAARAHASSHVRVQAHAFASRLTVEKCRVVGVQFTDELDGASHEVRAGAVLLASGGLGQLFRETTNPEGTTGDGIAMAYEAGAELSDVEFVQFYPTALCIKGAPRLPLSEALLVEGGVLRNLQLERFMKRYHEAHELAPREVISRAIISEMHRTQSPHVYLDMTAKPKDFFEKRFPRIYAACIAYGVDLAADLAPVSPAAHFAIGGVKTDLWGRSSVAGLYAAGEAANSGLHGANQFSGNSLLDALVLGARAGESMVKDAPGSHKKHGILPGAPIPKPDVLHGIPAQWQQAKSTHRASELQGMRDLLWKHVGVLRNGKDLKLTVETLRTMELPNRGKHGRLECELRNQHLLGSLIACCALAREESRGSHYRSDFPYRDDDTFQRHSVVSKDGAVHFV